MKFNEKQRTSKEQNIIVLYCIIQARFIRHLVVLLSPSHLQVSRLLQCKPLCWKTSSWTKTKRGTLQRFYYLKREFHVVFSFLSLLLHLGKAQKQPVSPNYLSHRAQSGNLAQSRLWFIEPDDLKLLGGTSQPNQDWNCSMILSWYLAAQVAPPKVTETKIACYFWSSSFFTLWKKKQIINDVT